MIYINFKRERFYIDKSGNVLNSMDIPEDYPIAILTEQSAIKNSKDSSYRFYVKSNNLYYLETEKLNENTKSLLNVLNVREGVITGIYFASRVLLFTYIHGLLKHRFSSDDIQSSSDIIYPTKEWGLPHNAPIEVYGATIPLEKLYSRIVNTPKIKDLEHERKKFLRIQYITGALLVLISIGLIGVVELMHRNITEDIKKTKNKHTEIQNDIKTEAFKRLPLRLDFTNIPIDEVFKTLSFLENARYSVINVTAEGESINVQVTVQSPVDAYKVLRLIDINKSQYDSSGQINTMQGGEIIEITFDKRLFKKSSNFTDSVDYSVISNIQ